MQKLTNESPLRNILGIEKITKKENDRGIGFPFIENWKKSQENHEYINVPTAMALIGASRDQLNAAILEKEYNGREAKGMYEGKKYEPLFRKIKKYFFKYGTFYLIRKDEIIKNKDKILAFPRTSHSCISKNIT